MVRNRVCLKCDKSFLSRGPQNRICPKCHRLNAKLVEIPERLLQKERGRKFHNGEVIDQDPDSDF